MDKNPMPWNIRENIRHMAKCTLSLMDLVIAEPEREIQRLQLHLPLDRNDHMIVQCTLCVNSKGHTQDV